MVTGGVDANGSSLYMWIQSASLLASSEYWKSHSTQPAFTE